MRPLGPQTPCANLTAETVERELTCKPLALSVPGKGLGDQCKKQFNPSQLSIRNLSGKRGFLASSGISAKTGSILARDHSVTILGRSQSRLYRRSHIFTQTIQIAWQFANKSTTLVRTQLNGRYLETASALGKRSEPLAVFCVGNEKEKRLKQIADIETLEPFVPLKKALSALPPMSEPTLYRAAREGRLPFPALRIGHRWYVSRRVLQDLLSELGAPDAAA